MFIVIKEKDGKEYIYNLNAYDVFIPNYNPFRIGFYRDGVEIESAILKDENNTISVWSQIKAKTSACM